MKYRCQLVLPIRYYDRSFAYDSRTLILHQNSALWRAVIISHLSCYGGAVNYLLHLLKIRTISVHKLWVYNRKLFSYINRIKINILLYPHVALIDDNTHVWRCKNWANIHLLDDNFHPLWIVFWFSARLIELAKISATDNTSHPIVLRSAAIHRRHPIDILHGVFNVACLTMNTIGSVYLKSLFGRMLIPRYELVDTYKEMHNTQEWWYKKELYPLGNSVIPVHRRG